MANFNKVLLMGNLTRDPETKFLPSGAGVVEFGLAVNRTWTDQQSGEKREATTFVDCKAWGKQGEILTRYCKKGSPLFVEGRLEYRTWETNGEKRSKHEIVVENFQFIGAPKSEGSGGGGSGEGGGGGMRRGPTSQRGSARGPEAGQG